MCFLHLSHFSLTYVVIQRIERGWFTEEGIHIPPLSQDPEFHPNTSARSAPDTADTKERYLEKIYSTDSRTTLTNLKKAFLLTLCATWFKHPESHYNGMNKPEIVESIINTVSLQKMVRYAR